MEKIFKKYLHSEEIHSIESQELLFEFLPEVYHSTEWIRWDIENRGNNVSWQEDAPLMSIDKLQKRLHEMKEKGCNYVEIMHHTDHEGYVFNGAKVWKPSNEELQKIEDERQEKLKQTWSYQAMALEMEITEKKKQLQKLHEKINKE